MNPLRLRVSVTGASSVNQKGEDIIHEALKSSPFVPDEFTTGGAHGADTIAAVVGFQLFRHRCSIFRLCYPEGLPYNEMTREFANLIIPVEGGYLKRDDALVEYCGALWAFPRTWREEQRSGTWATIRRARKAGRYIDVFPLDGSDPWSEVPTKPGERLTLDRG